MTSLRQITANRLNALKSTGPRTAEGKQQSRRNALSHGLTSETVITALEHAADYQALEASLLAEHQPRSATDRELVVRLASVLWRLRRATSIETGLFQIQGAMIQEQRAGHPRRRTVRPPEWLDELDNVRTLDGGSLAPRENESVEESSSERPERLADCFLQVSRLGYGTFDLLNRYEAALWRQAAQLLFLLQQAARRQKAGSRAFASQPTTASDQPNGFVSVRPEGACHRRRREPPRELSIDLVADERLGRATGRVEAS